MTPKQKAEEIIAKFYPMMDMSNGDQVKKALAKHSATIAVDLILDALDENISISLHPQKKEKNGCYAFYLNVKEEIRLTQ